MSTRPLIIFDNPIARPLLVNNQESVSELLGSLDRHTLKPLAPIVLVRSFEFTTKEANRIVSQQPEFSGVLYTDNKLIDPTGENLPHTYEHRPYYEFYPSRAALPSRRINLGEITASLQEGNFVFVSFGGNEGHDAFEAFAHAFRKAELLLNFSRHTVPLYGASRAAFTQPDMMASKDFPHLKMRVINSAKGILAPHSLGVS